MNCPSCGAPMQIAPDGQSFKCAYCQGVYFPEKNDDGVRVLDVPSSQDCPLCATPLMQATLAGIRILYCKQCGGMLIAMQALENLIDALRAQTGGSAVQPPADAADLRRKMNCPACHKSMDAHFYAGPGNVVIDSCGGCMLVWMDRGKLLHIARAPDPERSTESEW